MVRKVPEVLEGFIDRAAGLLNDRHHGVLLAGVTLMLEVCTVEPNVVPLYRQHVPTLARVLKTLLMSPYSPEHDVGGITDPFLQVKVSAAAAVPPAHVVLAGGPVMGGQVAPANQKSCWERDVLRVDRFC